MLSPQDLSSWADLVADRVADKLAKRPMLVDRVELAQLLGVSIPTVERLSAAGKIPLVRLGRRVLYDPVAVIEARSSKVGGGYE